MKYYWVKTHPIVRRIFSKYIWHIPSREKTVYLTFDDGPTDGITNWVLSQLTKYNAKATFFLIGRNVNDHPEIVQNIVAGKHSIGNHTYNHLNGWHVTNDDYFGNIRKCDEVLREHAIETKLFRPPYGKLKSAQTKFLLQDHKKIIMWDILSADFDLLVSPEKCLQNVLKNIGPGSIVIFHDSVKAFRNLEYVLPKTLEYLKKEGYTCAAL